MRSWRRATGCPSCEAITSTSPVLSTSGARMNTPGNVLPLSPSMRRGASKLSTWRPYPLRRTPMSSRPRPCCSAIPSATSLASTIMPAQVARVARPPRIASRRGSSRPTRSMSIVIVVLSPPGSTIPSRPARSSCVRTSRVRAPVASSARTCSAKAPCIARTPMRGCLLPREAELPASGSEQLVLRDGRDLEAVHRFAKPRRDLGQHLWLVVIGRSRDDRLGTLQGVLGLEDARPDEHAINAQLHHQRRVRRSRDPTGGKVDHRQPAQLLTLDEHLDRRADLLGFVDKLGMVQAQKPADARVDRARMAHGFDHVAGSGFALGADYRGAFGDPARRFAEVAAPAHE